MANALMDSVKQTVTIHWQDMSVMPKEEGTYLVAFDDGTVETYPIGYNDIQTGVIQDGYCRGIFWAETFKGPVCHSS